MLRFVLMICALLAGAAAQAGALRGEFQSVDGGGLSLDQWQGQSVLVVNTASRCGYTYQYEGMQALYDAYRGRGLVVLAVPSDDFRQELGSAEEVKEFCELTFGLDMPMTDITPVRGAKAHPFYQDVKAATGFVPGWNFNKVLVGPDGNVVATWGSNTRPESQEIRARIELLLTD